jgi:hypothetical protein
MKTRELRLVEGEAFRRRIPEPASIGPEKESGRAAAEVITGMRQRRGLAGTEKRTLITPRRGHSGLRKPEKAAGAAFRSPRTLYPGSEPFSHCGEQFFHSRSRFSNDFFPRPNGKKPQPIRKNSRPIGKIQQPIGKIARTLGREIFPMSEAASTIRK